MNDTQSDHEFVEAMKSEHRELGSALANVRAEVASESRKKKTLEDLVTQLRELIEAHFAHEEFGGYLKEALDKAPRFTVQAAALQDQHEDLLEDIEKLRILVHSGVESPVWWSRVEADFRAFAARLLNHEHAENRIVQEAFTVDIGTAD